MTAGLIAFLNARLDEDEAAAKDASGSDWRLGGSVWMMRAHPSEVQMVRTDAGLAVIHDDGSPTDAEAIHIARHDPARVLREVAFKRDMVRRCATCMNELDVYPNGLVSPRALLARLSLVGLAAIYSNHPDYRQEWEERGGRDSDLTGQDTLREAARGLFAPALIRVDPDGTHPEVPGRDES